MSEKAQQDLPYEVMEAKPESPDVMLEEAYVSAMNIAVERPLPLANKPPTNFAVVLPGLFRSAYPEAADYPFMQTLNLKTIVTLVGKELPQEYQEFIQANGIAHDVFDMVGTKKAVIPTETMQSILSIVNDRKNYPLLIHCNHGRHRTGCVIGALRKIHEWDTTSVIQEYSKFAEPKAREADVKYLTDFKPSDFPNSKPLSRRIPYTYIQYAWRAISMLISVTLYVWVYRYTRILLTIV